ncbi:MAG: hypothetical protein V2A54_11620 [Bacteroidota bacterium]
MKKMLILVCFAIMASGCSWVEYFVIRNESNSIITLEYEIIQVNSGFPIFYQIPSLYPMSKSGSIEWESKQEGKDEDEGPLLIKMQIPPRTAVVFGSLMNDKYTTHTQYFINGRVFNLKSIRITKNSTMTDIIPKNFDDVFIKKNGQISYSVL